MNNDSLKIMDLNSREIVKSVQIENEQAISLKFDSETNILFAGSDDGSMIVVNPSAYTWYEGTNYQLRAESTADGSINVGVYSFGACAIKLAGGAFRNNK
jgi:hypothetical protein